MRTENRAPLPPFLLFTFPFLLCCSCAAPTAGVWPPEPGAPRHRIVVSVDAWHSMIGFPREAAGGEAYEEWGYAEKAWYLEGKQGSSGAVRAMGWPTDGVIEIASGPKPWAERSHNGGGRKWTLHVSDPGLALLRAYLRDSLGDPAPLQTGNGRTWHLSARDYHCFHHCHHYTALALRRAGLPIDLLRACTPGGLADEVARCAVGERRSATEDTENNSKTDK